ncbi:MAG TPA: hypothetical protein VK932_09180 [Kofleriaceae bacterium]|nr:hypothetical protein [Kofleriaceae bacterium]
MGDAITDPSGRFVLDAGLANGLIRIRASGGSFVDLATGATIQLDPTDALTSLVWFELVEVVEDALVSPIGHLIDARTRVKLPALGDLTEAAKDASSHLGRHFGNVADWTRLHLVGLDRPATSPTEGVRAALVHAALSYLARDIAAEAGSSPQEVNVLGLTQRWAADLARGPAEPAEAVPVFDGNDGNDRRPGSGLQLGACAPVAPSCQVPASACGTGHCRPLCDLHVGTPRALLAGAMTKVIRDNGPGGVNQTGLRIEDTLAIARSVSDNVDPDLFGGACIETLDRTAPEVRWDEAHSAPAGAVVRGVIQVKAIALDDVDPRPRAQILGYADVDGDPADDVALANVDTTAAADGPLTLTARAVDQAGNSAAVERQVVIDNTAPELALSPAGFLADGATWWTTAAAPALTGTFADANPASVKATVGGTQVTGTLSGGTWAVTLPAGAIDLAGADVTVTITDRAGNAAARTQRIRRDATPPELSFQPSPVSDEAAEVPAFALDESPIHSHSGAPIDLAVAGACPAVTKYSYLLRAASPPHVTEAPGRNPIAYRLVAADDGIGLAGGSTQYRVLRREAAGPAVVLDWTSAGPGTPIGTGARLFDVEVVADLVPGLDTTEGIYDVELRATDRLARTTAASRCFELRLKAPPLHFLGGGPAAGHGLALDSLSLAPGAAHDRIAARLLNDDATGASLLDQPIVNGTTETVFLTVTVTQPSSVTATQAFEIRNHTAISPVTIECYVGPDKEWNPACDPMAAFPPGGGYSSGPITTTATALTFPVKLFELDGAGAPATEIPCLPPCSPVGSVFKFAVPPRAAGGPARRFVVMTMIGQVSNLWPKDGNQNAAPPFSDFSIQGGRYTGRYQFFSSGCGKYGPGMATCQERWQRTQYRALTDARLDFATQTIARYATAATVQLVPVEIIPSLTREADSGWDTAEGILP